jgi:hypothetical protein
MSKGRPSPDWQWVASDYLMGVRYVGFGWLDIRFKPNGFTARYFDVPVEVYWALLAAGSKGKFFHNNIKGKYDWTEI